MLDDRYTQQINLPDFGIAGQKKISNAHVVCIGAGGLGSSCLYYLVAAGVGTITIVDGDTVELSNLHRQILFTTADIGANKVESARHRLLALNPDIQINIHPSYLDAKNATSMLQLDNLHYDVIIDAGDNLALTYLLNDIACKYNIPLIYASANKFNAQLAFLLGSKGACYKCVYPQYTPIAEDCATSGILGALVGMMGSMQALETIKYLVNSDNISQSYLLTVDTQNMRFNKIPITKDANCDLCGKNNANLVLKDYVASHCAVTQPQLEHYHNSILIDVRSLEEWQVDGLLGSHNIPLSKLLQADVQEHLPDDKAADYLIYCASGMRSDQALKIFQHHGFKNVSCLKGGLRALQQT